MRKFLLLLLLLPHFAWGAVAVEATGGIAAASGADSLTVTGYTVTAATEMLVGVSLGSSVITATNLVTGITWNGAALTKITASAVTDGTYTSAVWWALANPSAATGNIVATADGTTFSNEWSIHVITFTGASTTLGTPSTATGTTTNPSLTVAASVSGDIVVALLCTDNDTATTTPANTQIFTSEGLGGDTDHNSQYVTASGANTVMSWTNSASGSDAVRTGLAVSSATSVVRDQEGFRWGVDDANEASHTFEAAQDTNISLANNRSRLLRALVNATDDPASTAYTLRSQKNGSGGYVAVPVGSTVAFSITNQNVAASSDDSQDLAGTNTINGTTIGGSLDATNEWAGMRFTNITIPVGATITSASVGVVPSATTEDEPLVTVFLEAADNCATYTTGASNLSGRSRGTGVSWSSADLAATGASYHSTPDLTAAVQAVINRAGWVSGNALCVHIQGGATTTRDLTIEAQDLGPNTNPPRLSVAWTTPNQVYVTTSANIAAGGEATTARLTAPSGKTTGDFVTGRRWDDENGTDSIDITTDDYTEVEWLVFIAASAANGDIFDFRVYAGSSALDTYTLTPRWTIPGGATGLLLRRRRN